MRLEPWKDIAIGAGVGALSGLAGSVAGYGTVDWGWLASAGASGAAGSGTGLGLQALDGGVTWKEAGIAMASGIGSSIASGAAMRPFSSSAGDLVIDQDGDGNLYRASDYMIDQAVHLFEDWAKAQGFKAPNLKDVRLQFGETNGAPAFTVNDRITLNEAQWSQTNLPDRVELLIHELSHTVQYENLGGGTVGAARFLARYSGEYGPESNYQVPKGLAQTRLQSVDPLSPGFTLDQIAEHIAKTIYRNHYAH